MKLVISAAIVLSFVACTNEPDTRAGQRDPGRDAANPLDAGSSRSDDPPCEPKSRELGYGKTIPGRWLEELFVDVGAPCGHRTSRSEIKNTGTALWIDIPAHKENSTIYATMLTPDTDRNLTPSATEKEIGNRGSYILYFKRGNFAWQSYRASNGKWQLSLIAYPGADSDIVAWPRGTIDWLHEAVDRAERSPPKCRGSLT